MQRLFHEALKAINGRCQSYSTYDHEEKKKLSRVESLPLFINLMKFEVANRRFEVANKLCERLLQANDAGLLKEIWLCKIFILRSQKQAVNEAQKAEELSIAIEKTIEDAIKTFPLDAQVVYVAAQYFAVSSTFLVHSLVIYFGRLSFASPVQGSAGEVKRIDR